MTILTMKQVPGKFSGNSLVLGYLQCVFHGSSLESVDVVTRIFRIMSDQISRGTVAQPI